MPSEPRKDSEEVQEATIGSLRACLVEGDAEQRNRERKIRRRALIISVSFQTVFLAALILLPLLGKTERIALGKEYVPIPPYGPPRAHQRATTVTHPSGPVRPSGPYPVFGPTVRPAPPTGGGDEPVAPLDVNPGGDETAIGPPCSWCVPAGERNTGPRPPQPAVDNTSRPHVVKVTTIDPALQIRRVDPVYPALAKQTHREGRVELRAIIATDGSIQSLEIVGGDPIFFLSAREAVSQWRYKPTILNGQAVEVDTHITVIYVIQH